MPKLLFKEAQNADELEQIHALNHRVFAEEIAQHRPLPSGLLIDRFHSRNRYFVALRDGVVIGMISAHAGPEFSIARRLPDAALIAGFARPLEVRLLAIAAQERSRTVLAGLLWQVYQFAVSNGFSHLLISALEARESMYRKIGFHPLGPAVPDGCASFIPMVMGIKEHLIAGQRRIRMHKDRWNRHSTMSDPISLMPGPVCIHPRVAEAFASAPVSHRSPAFIECYEKVRSLLKGLLNGAEVALFTGTGTLANDAVAANLKAIFGSARGSVISNGEFGERIAKQAAKAGLEFDHAQFGWRDAWSIPAIQDNLDRKPAWIWAVQLETSTGVLNDTDTLLKLAGANKCAVALDCVSSVGASPIAANVGPLLMASGVSGKSLGAYAGLSFVYISDECRHKLSNKILCPSFDLLCMHKTYGPVSTVLSSSIFALSRALEQEYGSPEAITRRFQEYRSLGEQMRRLMREIGLEPLAPESVAAPNIATFALPSPSFPEECLSAGYQIAHESPYLRSRGWGQMAWMGNLTSTSLEGLFRKLRSR
ncbi:MAG: aminotransferase class V-fold PLP-dependent enzyme [Acidobacteriaceae bacterium]|nr:aminotransferase class V-fold PLP-dependent enzyme [Acidobacteriaceae bacterium]